MGKHIFVLAFVTAVISAFTVYLRRGERQAQSLNPDHDKHPRITIEEFVIYEYENHQPKTSFQGNLAQFQDPDMLEVFGNIRGSRSLDGHKETMRAETMTVRFATKGLTEVMKNSEPLLTELENQVRFSHDDLTMSTDYAKVLHEPQLLTSDRPVRIQSNQADMKGSKGFEFNAKSQDLKVFGPMEGTLVDEQK